VLVLAVAGTAFAGEAEERMMKLTSPGEHHVNLSKMAGEFTYTSKMWMEPGGEAMESSGEKTAEMVMGGRYLKEFVTGNVMGMPFEGMAITGYDNASEEFIFTWIDNFGTGILSGTGRWDEHKGYVFEGDTFDINRGEMVHWEQVVKVVTDDKHKLEWFMPGPDGTPYKMMEIVYLRKAGS